MVTNEKPVCIFKDPAEINEFLWWWQDKLFLNDWIITCKVISKDDFENEDSAGENLMIYESKCAVIHLIDPKDYPSDAMLKLCHEKILVHELLHCLYNFITPAEKSYESVYLDARDHQQLEAMAKSLIMVKYNIPLEWFAKDASDD